jgi:hypothetical protein
VEIFRLIAINMINSNDLDEIHGKTTLIFNEIRVVTNLNGIYPFIFQTLKPTFSYSTRLRYLLYFENMNVTTIIAVMMATASARRPTLSASPIFLIPTAPK